MDLDSPGCVLSLPALASRSAGHGGSRRFPFPRSRRARDGSVLRLAAERKEEDDEKKMEKKRKGR